MDELNCKKVRLLDASTEALQHTVKPLPKQLGQKYGNKFPVIQKAILAMNSEAVAHTLSSEGKLDLTVDGIFYAILPEEVEVKSLAREGFAVAEEGSYVAALVTELTPELVAEGMAREFVRRLQDFRKETGLDVVDRIRVYLVASPLLKDAILRHHEYITGETLTVELSFAAPPPNARVISDTFDGETVTIAPAASGGVTVPGAAIFYTLDGSFPAPRHGALYTAPFSVTPGLTAQATAWLAGYLSSPTAKHLCT